MAEDNSAMNKAVDIPGTKNIEYSKDEKSKKRISLQEMASKEHIVLIDACGYHNFADGREDFCKKIYDTDNRTGLGREITYCESRSIWDLTDILEQDNVFTIPEVVNEIRGKLKSINAKCHYFKGSTKIDRRARRKLNIVNHSKERINELQHQVYSTIELAKKKDIRWCKDLTDIPKYEQKFHEVLEMIKLLDKAIGLKKDTGYFYGERERDMSGESDTDERIVAHAYCISMLSSKKPIVISGDTDLIRLMGVTPRLMGAEDLMPSNELFRRRLVENPFKLCFNDHIAPGNYSLAIDGADGYDFNKIFCVHCARKEKNEEMASDMKKLWENFNSQ